MRGLPSEYDPITYYINQTLPTWDTVCFMLQLEYQCQRAHDTSHQSWLQPPLNMNRLPIHHHVATGLKIVVAKPNSVILIANLLYLHLKIGPLTSSLADWPTCNQIAATAHPLANNNQPGLLIHHRSRMLPGGLLHPLSISDSNRLVWPLGNTCRWFVSWCWSVSAIQPPTTSISGRSQPIGTFQTWGCFFHYDSQS